MHRLSKLLIAGCLVLGVFSAPALARNNDSSNDAGGSGRMPAETWTLDHIKLQLPEGELDRVMRVFITKLGRRAAEETPPPQQVLVDATIVEVTDVNKLDLSGIPLFGGFVGPEFNADDMTEENKVGNVFGTGNGGLFVVLQPTALGDPGSLNLGRLLVFNDDYSYEVKPLQLTVVPTVSADRSYLTMQLDTLAELPSVRSVTTNVTVPDGGTILLGGLKEADHRNDESQVPFLSDLPVLNQMFRGTAHQADEQTLLILVKPSVLIQNED